MADSPRAQAVLSSARGPITQRLEDQIEWYDRKSASPAMVPPSEGDLDRSAAALVPLFSSLDDFGLFAGVLGVLVVSSEGLQHVNQHHENWIRYRATARTCCTKSTFTWRGPGTMAATPMTRRSDCWRPASKRSCRERVGMAAIAAEPRGRLQRRPQSPAD